MRPASLYLVAFTFALACSRTEPPHAESPPAPASSAKASPTPAASAPEQPAASAVANPWTTPSDCAAREASAEQSGLTPEERKRNRFNCDLSEELRTFVAPRQACQSAADCSNVAGSCPFGCAVPVAQSAEAEVSKKLAELVLRTEKAGTRCMYKCVAAAAPVCSQGRCTAP